MAILSLLTDPSPRQTALLREVLKYGAGPVIGLGLAYFLATSVTAKQDQTLAVLHEHQRDAQALLEVARLTCAQVATDDAQRSLCFQVGRRAQ